MSDFCNPMYCSTTGLPVHHQLPDFTQIHVHWVGGAIQPSHPLLSPSPPTCNLSEHQGLFNESVHIRWPKYWSFSFSISPSNKYSGLIFFRMDWLDLLAVQGTLKSLLQHHSSKASILQHSAFFIVRLSHSYTTTGYHRSYDITVLLFSSGWNDNLISHYVFNTLHFSKSRITISSLNWSFSLMPSWSL